MNATTALESTPPDRNAPIGTSLTICMRTDSSRRAANRARPMRLRSVRGRRRRKAPVAVLARRGRRSALSSVAGGSLRDAAKDRLRRRHVAEREVRAAAPPDRARRVTPGSARIALASLAKTRRLRVAAQVQRLDAEPVAPEQQALAPRIPQREREHAVQVLDERVAVLLRTGAG